MPVQLILLVVVTSVAAVAGLRFQRRWKLLRTAYGQMEQYADTLLQHSQGTILNVQGIVSALRDNDPVRMRVEEALSRAERELTEFRETMQPRCSEQQEDRIQ